MRYGNPDRGQGLTGGLRNLYLLPSSPLRRAEKALPSARSNSTPGIVGRGGAAGAAGDVRSCFAVRVEGEGFDIAAVAAWGQTR